MIGFFVLHSSLEKKNTITNWKDSFYGDWNLSEEVTDLGTINKIDQLTQLINDKHFTSFILLLATGGTEQLVELVLKRFMIPTLIWTHGDKNSLASGLEIMGAYKKTYPLSMVYGSTVETKVTNTISHFISVSRLIRKLNYSNIGFIGDPSEWLLVSQNTNSIPFNLDFTFLGTKEIYAQMKLISDDQVETCLADKIPCLNNKEMISEADLITSLKVYEALKNMIEKHHLDALTLRCFDLLSKKFTACLALSLLNDQGFPAGCEGDKHAIIGLLIAQILGGKPGWMANPSSVNDNDNTITFAHCTVPISMLDKDHAINFKTHMESDLSLAIEGSLEKKTVTIFRLGGEYDTLMAVRGEIIESNQKNPLLCRTQAKVYIEGHLSEWLEKTCGNHQIIVYGDIIEELKMFCSFYKVQLIEIS